MQLEEWRLWSFQWFVSGCCSELTGPDKAFHASSWDLNVAIKIVSRRYVFAVLLHKSCGFWLLTTLDEWQIYRFNIMILRNFGTFSSHLETHTYRLNGQRVPPAVLAPVSIWFIVIMLKTATYTSKKQYLIIWIGNVYVAVAEKNWNICIYSLLIYTGIYNINLIRTCGA